MPDSFNVDSSDVKGLNFSDPDSLDVDLFDADVKDAAPDVQRVLEQGADDQEQQVTLERVRPCTVVQNAGAVPCVPTYSQIIEADPDHWRDWLYGKVLELALAPPELGDTCRYVVPITGTASEVMGSPVVITMFYEQNVLRIRCVPAAVD